MVGSAAVVAAADGSRHRSHKLCSRCLVSVAFARVSTINHGIGAFLVTHRRPVAVPGDGYRRRWRRAARH
jgi:hypothetical protein